MAKCYLFGITTDETEAGLEYHEQCDELFCNDL